MLDDGNRLWWPTRHFYAEVAAADIAIDAAAAVLIIMRTSLAGQADRGRKEGRR